MRQSFYDFRHLMESSAPEDFTRRHLIEEVITNPAFDATLEPMTVQVTNYQGNRDLRYTFPNPNTSANQRRDGTMSSIYKDWNSWRHIETDVMRALSALSGSGRGTWHLMCVRYQPDDLKKKVLFPLLIIAEPNEGEFAGHFSKRFARAYEKGTYELYCEQENAKWLDTLEG